MPPTTLDTCDRADHKNEHHPTGSGCQEFELIRCARDGDVEAVAALYRMHEGYATRYARSLTKHPAEAHDLVSDAFFATFQALRRGKGSTTSFRAYLSAALRHHYYSECRRRARTVPTDDLELLEQSNVNSPSGEQIALDTMDAELALAAFRSLPPRWQHILWKMDVEQASVAVLAEELAVTANSLSALAYRARKGLATAFLQQHVEVRVLLAECRDVAASLAQFVRAELGAERRSTIHTHLRDCATCMATLSELASLNSTMLARRR